MKERDRIVTAFSEMSQRYETKMNNELNRFWGWSYEEFVTTLLKNVQIKPTDAILDVATGTSVIPLRLFQTTPNLKQVVGLDITLDMLLKGRQNASSLFDEGRIQLICGTALAMPLTDLSFELVLCGLATHHMEVKNLLMEIHRVLKPHGRLAIADVGGARSWKNPIVKTIIRILAFFYFFFTESKSRAWVEASALTNIRTAQEWQVLLQELGFNEIAVYKMQSKKLWMPNPIIINAMK
jgi:ubiquinone/menaquinone biosynthesis C-methylase UbiE